MSEVDGLSDLDHAMLMTKEQVAHLFDVSRATVTQWQRNGMPTTEYWGPKNERYYNARAVFEWFMETKHQQRPAATAKQEADLRQKTLRGDRLEIELMNRAQELVPAERVLSIITGYISASRARLLSIPARIAPRAARMSKAKDIERATRDIVNEALKELREIRVEDFQH